MTVSNVDLLRTAHAMMKRYGKRANIEAAERANAARAEGDLENYETWQWVCMWIQDLERKKPLPGESLH